MYKHLSSEKVRNRAKIRDTRAKMLGFDAFLTVIQLTLEFDLWYFKGQLVQDTAITTSVDYRHQNRPGCHSDSILTKQSRLIRIRD